LTMANRLANLVANLTFRPWQNDLGTPKGDTKLPTSLLPTLASVANLTSNLTFSTAGYLRHVAPLGSAAVAPQACPKGTLPTDRKGNRYADA
jgi:hypothetical protein